MEIDALEHLIIEDVKVQGQISCVMVSELASWSLESSLELLLESSPELLPESSPEEMRSTSTTLLPGSSLEESSLTSMRVDRFFLRVEEKPTSPWRASLEYANLAFARVYSFLPWGDEEPASSMERRGKRKGAARWDGSSSSPRNLTLLAGAADSTEEDGRGRGRGASSLQNLPLESRAIPTTETRCDGDEEGGSRRRG
jgi:hypothetical protein